MKHFISILTGRKGELQSICALILTVFLSQVSPFEYKTYQVGVIKFTTLEGVGFSLSWFFLAAAGWMLNQTFQSQRPDGTRNALYFLSYMLLCLSITDAEQLFSTSAVGLLFAVCVSCLHQATFQKRPEGLVALSGFLMSLLILIFPASYPWLLILFLLLILAEEFSFRMLAVFLVGVLLVPYLWFSLSYLFQQPLIFWGWVGYRPWAEPVSMGSSVFLPWVSGVGVFPVIAGMTSTLMNRQSRTRISRTTQRHMGILLVSGICLLILASTQIIPLNPLSQVLFLLPALSYLSARGIERMAQNPYSELFLWLWMALVCGGAEGLNRWVFSSFLPL